MAKKTRKHAPKELTRKQRSRLERERRMEKILLWSMIAVGIVVVGVLGYGLVVEKIIKVREAVATVDDTPITTAEFQARVRFMRMQMQDEFHYWSLQQQSLDPTDPDAQFYLEYIQGNLRDLQGQLSSENALVVGDQTLDQLIQEELVRQEAARRDITVTPEEVQSQVEAYFGYDPNPATPTPAPTFTPALTPIEVLTPTPTTAPLPTATPMTEEDFHRLYDTYLQGLKSQDISEQQYRSWVEASLLIEKVQEQMNAEAPTTADQVKLRLLNVDDEDLANELAARLDAGEDFQVLVDELEADEEAAGRGTELAWFPRSMLENYLGAELADLAFTLEIGERSQPVLGEDGTGYTIIVVVGHGEHELEQFLREQMGKDMFREWLEAQQILVERGTYRDRVPTKP